jgi:uncharacterized protein YyaL (SSP411 family)
MSQVFTGAARQRPSTSAAGLRSAGGERLGEPTVRGSASLAFLFAVALLAVPNQTLAAKNTFIEKGLPGAPTPGAELVRKLNDKWERRPPSYNPRTKHLNDDGTPKYTNRLFLSSSPYLLQHAHNPVNWYPWGDEAFEAARKLGRPVLLSVGYSTCHWCHVMEEESFEDVEIARYLNQHYIAVKVDREERPDVDAIYMSAVQALAGRGGWPMTVWLTPDRMPFYGGTYFPPKDGDRGSRVGFLTLLQRVSQAYRDHPDEVRQSATALTERIRGSLIPPSSRFELPGTDVLHAAAQHYEQRFDARHGGLQGAPKFPSNLPNRFLLQYHRRTRQQRPLDMAVVTLTRMAAGGMYDHVGGGFHRYSTDRQWLVPHFEKMLYDNALLTLAYLDAYQVSADPNFARVAREILRYVERDMTSPLGAFYSATDADSLTPGGHREEGWFFTWTPAEIDAALDADQARIVKTYYGVTAAGNFEGRNILHAPRPLAEAARELRLSPESLRAILDAAKKRLYQARSKRPAPLRDEKILAAWNGLMISAYARAAMVLAEPGYAATAARAAQFVLAHMRNKGRLLRSYSNAAAHHNGYLDDYAFLIAGLLDLHEVTSDSGWLREAIALDRFLERHYEDRSAGGFFMVGDDHEKLLAREKPSYDGAEPSGNSVQVLNLLRLHELTTDDSYRKRADAALRCFASVLQRAPAALSEMLLALDFRTDTPKEVVIVCPDSRADAEPFLQSLRQTFLPNRVLSVVTKGKDLEQQKKLIPLLQGKVARQGKATGYVCENRICALPTNAPEVFREQLATVSLLSRSETQQPLDRAR